MRLSIVTVLSLGAGLILAATYGIAFSSEQVRKSRAEAIEVLNQSATMYESRDYFITQVTGPVGKEGIPHVIRLGDAVTVKGKTINVNHIVVTQYLAELKWGNEVLARPGDVKCLLVESEKDIPSGDEYQNRLWINVDKCRPIPASDRPVGRKGGAVLLMTVSKWDDLTEAQKSLYVKGFLEAVSFFMYGHYPRNTDALEQFSDWTACAQRERTERWKPLGWLFGEMDRTVASQLYEIAPIVCKNEIGKGDKTWNPLKLVSEKEWSSLSRSDREIYVTAYVETSYESLRRTEHDDQNRRLEICVANRGIEAIMNAVEQTVIEWQYPLPWSIARATGKACPPEAAVSATRTGSFLVEAWRFLDDIWSALFVFGLVIIAPLLAIAAWLSMRIQPKERLMARTRRAIKHAEFLSKPRSARILLRFAGVWIALVLLVNVGAVCGAFLGADGILDGVRRVRDMYDPWQLGTYIINAVLLVPAFVAYEWAGRIESKVQQRKMQTGL